MHSTVQGQQGIHFFPQHLTVWFLYLESLETVVDSTMRKEIMIRMQPDSDKSHQKALKVAATVSGVGSVTVTGRDKDLLLVIGDGVDTSKLIKKLRKEVGEVEIVELRTLDAGSTGELLPAGTSKDIVAAQSQSPYHWHPSTPGRSLPGGDRITYPVATPLAVADPGAARWPAENRQAGYYPRTPSPSYYYPSPMAGHGGYGSSYARAAALSHPANYSPMIERHDYNAVGRSSKAGRHRHEHDGGEPKCCSIL